MVLVLTVLLAACVESEGDAPPTSTEPVPVTIPSRIPWPRAYETYICSALAELEQLDRAVADLRSSHGLTGDPRIVERAAEIDDLLSQAIRYLSETPEWAAGDRLANLLRRATGHYRRGSSLLRAAILAPRADLEAALAALDDGRASMQRAESERRDLERATGFQC